MNSGKMTLVLFLLVGLMGGALLTLLVRGQREQPIATTPSSAQVSAQAGASPAMPSAQQPGAQDVVTCRKLDVVGPDGHTIAAEVEGNQLRLFDGKGNVIVELRPNRAGDGGAVETRTISQPTSWGYLTAAGIVVSTGTEDHTAVFLGVDNTRSSLFLGGSPGQEGGVMISADPATRTSTVRVSDLGSKERAAALIAGPDSRSLIFGVSEQGVTYLTVDDKASSFSLASPIGSANAYFTAMQDGTQIRTSGPAGKQGFFANSLTQGNDFGLMDPNGDTPWVAALASTELGGGGVFAWNSGGQTAQLAAGGGIGVADIIKAAAAIGTIIGGL